MINHVTINGKEVPFLFGYKVFYAMGRGQLLVPEREDDRSAVERELDTFLELLVLANKAACDKMGADARITKEELDNAMDESGTVYMDLNAAFEEAISNRFSAEKQGKAKGRPKR